MRPDIKEGDRVVVVLSQLTEFEYGLWEGASLGDTLERAIVRRIPYSHGYTLLLDSGRCWSIHKEDILTISSDNKRLKPPKPSFGRVSDRMAKFRRKVDQKKLDTGLTQMIIIRDGHDSFNSYPCNSHLCPGKDYKGIAVVPVVRTWKVAHEVAKSWLSYVVKRSPYKNAFLTKSTAVGIKSGYIMDIDTPSNYMCGAMIALRQPQENKLLVEYWHGLVQLGVHEDLAFLYGHLGTVSFSLGNRDKCHCCLNPWNWSRESVLNFCTKRNMYQANAPINEQSYSGVDALYDDQGFPWVSEVDPSKIFTATIFVADGWKGSKRTYGASSHDDWCKCMSVFLKREFPELHPAKRRVV